MDLHLDIFNVECFLVNNVFAFGCVVVFKNKLTFGLNTFTGSNYKQYANGKCLGNENDAFISKL